MAEINVVGVISKSVCRRLNLNKHDGKEIVVSSTLFDHISKHNNEYKSIHSCLYTLSNFKKVITNPDYVYFNMKNNSLEYYKYLMEPVAVIVKLTNKKKLYIASIFPVKTTKILNRISRNNNCIYEKAII